MNEPAADAGAPLSALLRRLTGAEALAALAILLAALIAWAWLASQPSMPDMPGMTMVPAPWTLERAAATFAMWAIMMAAMMLPAAAPIVLLHRRTAAQAQGALAPPTLLLVLGYTIVWLAFAAVATALQAGLSRAALLTHMDALADRRIAAGVLIAAGLYQFTPLKQACLALCRSPVAFLMRHYRAGAMGAFRMGAAHGLYCLGCCWAAMALLFVGGVMNLLWIAGLSAFVLIEKALPFGRLVGFALGAAALAFGGWLLVA